MGNVVGKRTVESRAEVQSGVDYGEAWRSSCGREGAAGPRSARVGWLQSSSSLWHVNMWEALLLHATAQLYHQVCAAVSPPLSPCIAPAEVLLTMLAGFVAAYQAPFSPRAPRQSW